MAVFGGVILAVLLRLSAGQDAICNFAYDVQPERTYYINDTNLREKQWNWEGSCPLGYRCRLDCLLNLPESPGCSADRLLISRSEGSKEYAREYCGPGSSKFVSYGEQISAGLKMSSPPGGNFSCQLTARKVHCRCGYKTSSRIVGGEETGVDEFPMMAYAVYFGQGVKIGVVIIDKRYVLTVAHGVLNGTKNLFVIMGKHARNITSKETPAPKSIAVAVERVIVHPQFSNLSRDYDIAILRLKQKIEYSDHVGPACLPFKFTRTSFTGSDVTLLGWGRLAENGSASEVLQKVDVAVISESECKAKHPELTPRQICTYAPGKDACQGDSGGPVLYTDPDTGLLFALGIISHERACAVEPAVHARVTKYLNWISRNTPDAKYCYK